MARPVKSSHARVNVLGVGVDPITVEELQAEIRRLAASRERGTVLNVNANCLNLLYGMLRCASSSAAPTWCSATGRG